MQLKKKRKRRQSVSATEEPGLLEAREDDRKERRRGRKVEDVVTSAGEGRGRWSGRCGHGSDPERGLDDCSVNSNPLRQGSPPKSCAVAALMPEGSWIRATELRDGKLSTSPSRCRKT